MLWLVSEACQTSTSAHSIRVSLDRVRRCPREIEEFDNAEEVPVSSLFKDPNTEEETETHCGITTAPATDVVEVKAAKQEKNCQFVGERGGSQLL